MMKHLGCLLVVLSCSMIGHLLAANVRNRPRQLREIQAALQMLATQVGFSANALPEAFDHVAVHCSAPVKPLFSLAAKELRAGDGTTAAEAWQTGLESARINWSLTRDDEEVLISLGSNLGVSDGEDQVRHLHLTCEQLKNRQGYAEELEKRNARLYEFMGLAVGLLLVIILY